eukprot:TRINITY_DN17457_c1_g1_i1.p1 TRINITY_DN17457_c1_g1~~TRINITY_DN17457_c1_g1_i1.p1  ORF type:complete len:485 (+),score=97.63 TRINITY_DN17457_c1_g1_i1:48-1457(+)
MQELKAQGNEAYKEGDYRRAIQLYTEALEEEGTDEERAMLYGNRAAARNSYSLYKDAIGDCEKALDLKPDFVKAKLRLAKAKWMLCDFTDAIRCYSEVLAKEPKNSEAKADIESIKQDQSRLESAKASMANFEYSAARNSLNHILEHCEGSREVLILKARCNIHSNPEIAARDMRNILQSNQNDSEALAIRGKALLYSGMANVSSAMQHFRQALSLDPDFTEAAKLLKAARRFENVKQEANDLFKARQYEEADEKYTEALLIDPQNKKLNSVLFNNRAANRMSLKRYEDALKDVNKAIEADEYFTKALVRRSRINEELEKWDDALKDMQSASEMDRNLEEDLHSLKKRVKMAKRKNFYKILGVSRDADDREIKKAYRLAAKEWHPDKWHSSGDEEKDAAEIKFKEIGEAYAILSDPTKRRKYDMGVLDGESDHQAHDPFEGGHPFGGGFGGGHPFFQSAGGGNTFTFRF